MKEYLMLEQKKDGNTLYYLLGNYTSTIMLKPSELKNKIRKGEISVLNLCLGQNGNLVEVPNNSNIQNSLDLFYLSLIDKIDVYNVSFSVVSDLLNRLKSINKRSISFKSDKDIIEMCISYLKSYFEYMGRTEYKFFKTKYDDVMFLKNKNQLKNIEETFEIVKGNLSLYVGNFLSNNEDFYKNAYNYKKFLNVIEDLFNKPYSIDNQKQISVALDLLSQFFDKVSYNLLSVYLYQNYILCLSKACQYGFEHKVKKKLDSFGESKRKELLDSTAGYDVKLYKERIRMVQENSQKVNDLVRNYSLSANSLLDCVRNTGVLNQNDISNLKQFLTRKCEEVSKTYDRIIYAVKQLPSNKGSKIVELMGNLDELSSCQNLSKFNCHVGGVKLILDTVTTVEDIIRTGIDVATNDSLSVESRQLLSEYSELSVGKKGILIYILDVIRLRSCGEKRRKKLRLYCDNGLIPLIDLTILNKYEIMGNHTTKSVYFLDHYRELETSWLTSYCIMNENIDNESLFVRKENANISWLLFKYCFDIRLPEKDFNDMYIFRHFLRDDRGWKIDRIENIKINISELLKNKNI